MTDAGTWVAAALGGNSADVRGNFGSPTTPTTSDHFHGEPSADPSECSITRVRIRHHVHFVEQYIALRTTGLLQCKSLSRLNSN